MPQFGFVESAFPPNPARVKCHIPRFRGDGSGRDFYVADAQHKLNCIPYSADVYRAATFRAKKRRTKELNFPTRPPRYKMDGSGRDGFVFLHENCGTAPKPQFRTGSTPWAAGSTAPWAFDRNTTTVAKHGSLRRGVPSSLAKAKGTKVVASRPFAPAPRAPLTDRQRRRSRRQKQSSTRLATPSREWAQRHAFVKTSRSKKMRPTTAHHQQAWLGNSRRTFARPMSLRPATAAPRVRERRQTHQAATFDAALIASAVSTGKLVLRGMTAPAACGTGERMGLAVSVPRHLLD